MAKNDLAMIKAENERLVTEVERLKQRLRVEITRTQAGVRLDLNLEKGRIREESSKQELKIKEVDTRIEQEIANLKTSIQASKATTLQYLVGFGVYLFFFSFLSCFAACRHFDSFLASSLIMR
jgi:Fe2+ transport system protein B